MYPRNAASPEPIAIGAVVQISDGAVQTSGVTVRIKPIGVSEGDGAGTTAYSTDGIVEYTPTQAETNYTSFILIAKKTGCIPVSVTVVTSASATPGYGGVDWGFVANKTTTNALTGTTIATTQKVDVDTIKTNPVVNAGTVTFPTTATLASTTNITAGTVTTATNLTNAPTSGDFTSTMKTSIGTAVAASAVASVTGNVGGNVTGSVGSVVGAVGSVTGAVGSVTAAVTLAAKDSPAYVTGTATAGGSTSITDSGATFGTNVFSGGLVKITSGTGAGQARVIVSHTGTVLTVDRAWTTNPSTDSVYAVLYGEEPALSSGLKITGLVLADTLTTYTGNTVQTGDSFARIGLAGVGLTNLGDTRIANLDATITSRQSVIWSSAGATVALTDTTIKTVSGAVGSVAGNVGGSVASVTAGVTLADSAITSAKFDGSTAFPIRQIDSGSTLIARTGADSDTLETLSDQIDAVPTASAPTAAANASAVRTELTTELGRIDAAITSRQATVTFPTNFSALSINSSGHVSRVTLTDTLTTYTSNTPQTGDNYAITNSGTFGNSALKTLIDAKPTLAQILAGGDVDGYTLEQTLKLCLAALAGKLSGAETTTVTIRAADDSKSRLVATVDASGNRSAVTLDAAG